MKFFIILWAEGREGLDKLILWAEGRANSQILTTKVSPALWAEGRANFWEEVSFPPAHKSEQTWIINYIVRLLRLGWSSELLLILKSRDVILWTCDSIITSNFSQQSGFDFPSILQGGKAKFAGSKTCWFSACKWKYGSKF